MSELQRVQVLIGSAQRKKLTRIARREGMSVSELVRELIERGLEQRAHAQPEWQAALARLRERRLRNSPSRVRNGTFLEEARKEREQQLERVWHPS
jgi:hypothetical protein